MIAGPAATGIMADWGADVIKVEPPGLGDPQRVFYQFSFNMPNHTPNAGFHVDNKGKRSVVLDLKSEEGAAAPAAAPPKASLLPVADAAAGCRTRCRTG